MISGRPFAGRWGKRRAFDAAIAGQGVALASRFLVDHDLKAGRLVQLSETCLSENTEFFLLAKRNRKRTPQVDQVIGWMLEEADGVGVR